MRFADHDDAVVHSVLDAGMDDRQGQLLCYPCLNRGV